MNISITTDADYITKCILINWDWLHDDSFTDKDFYFPPMGEDIHWINMEDKGVFLLERKNHIMYECHTALMPEAKGHATEMAKEALKFTFKNTPARRIITAVPQDNPLALRLALRAGFKIYGINENSFCKNGIALSQHLLGINKEDIWPQ